MPRAAADQGGVLRVSPALVSPESLLAPPPPPSPPEPSPQAPYLLAPRPLVHPEAVAAQGRRRVAGSTHPLAAAAARAGRAGFVLGALWLFAVALQLVEGGAAGLAPLLTGANVTGVPAYLGLGWLGACLLMSGSPVATIALSLFAGGVLSDTEAFAMINGSRLGASFVVLLVGFVAYAVGRRGADGLYIGAVSLLTALTLWAPVVPLGVLVLRQGWLDGVALGSPAALDSAVDALTGPAVHGLDALLPGVTPVFAGVAALVAAFALFDRALPNLENPGRRLEAASRRLQGRYAMFALGVTVTLLTMSVSLSLTVLVPLALKGYVKRESVIPYVMGANIATWIDTLFAALLLDTPRAFTIVFGEMALGAGVSLAALVAFYGPYSRFILGAAHTALLGRLRFSAFLAGFLLLPLALLLV
jgi:hypothetical protein